MQICPSPALDYEQWKVDDLTVSERAHFNGTYKTLSEFYEIHRRTRFTFEPADDNVMGDAFDVQVTNSDGSLITTNITISEWVKGSSEFVNEIQEVVTSAVLGEFHLEFGGEVTGGINFDASAGEVETMLESLSSVGSVKVSKTVDGNEKRWRVTFKNGNGFAGDRPLIEAVGGYGLVSDVSISEIVNGTAPVFGNFTISLAQGGVVQTSGAISYDVGVTALQVEINKMQFGSKATVVSKTANKVASYGSVWSISLNDESGLTEMTINTQHVDGPTSLKSICEDGVTCERTCTSATTPISSIANTVVVDLCDSVLDGDENNSDLFDWCNSELSTTTQVTTCVAPNWSACDYCTKSNSNDDYYGIKLTSVKNKMQGERASEATATHTHLYVQIHVCLTSLHFTSLGAGSGSLAAINNAMNKLVYNAPLNWHSTSNGFDEVTLIVGASTSTFRVNVLSVSDAPTISTTSDIMFAVEDNNLEITNIAINDVDNVVSDAFQNDQLTMIVSVSEGTLALASDAGLVFGEGMSTTPYAHSSLSVSGTLSALQSAIETVNYLPKADWNSATNFNKVMSLKIDAPAPKEVQTVIVGNSKR